MSCTKQGEQENNEKIILFFPSNSSGHTIGSIALADRLSGTAYQYKSLFVVVGKSLGDNIQSHGHKLIELQDLGGRAKEGKQQKDFGDMQRWTDDISSKGNDFTSDPWQSTETLFDICKESFFPVYRAFI